ncbi:N-acetylmuramoyl-L-alanine amidase [Cobetia sp. QF-1]|uniref:N-acetylmuramoyl-L-alanine amidase n=1 Tax=Cobetia sp. QF-1 TaxID=1969833 RepID=UPI000B548BA8|nr:N-acetylmuramoyl-L-alanine amidase [Cobetia sp. QF-1]
MFLFHLPSLLPLSSLRTRTALLLALPLALAGCASTSVTYAPVSTTFQLADTPLTGESDSRIHHLILHYTDDDLAGSLASLTGPRVSAHYLLSAPQQSADLPRVYALVPESRRAWHAGISHWAQRDNLNDTSIGIEIVNEGPLPLAPLTAGEKDSLVPGVARRWSPERQFAPWDEHQIQALIALIKPMLARHDIAPVDIIGHSDIAPDRKTDPGPRFPWQQLHEAGIGAWPADSDINCFRRKLTQDGMPPRHTLLKALALYGYSIDVDAPWLAIAAFQAHFRAGAITGQFDTESAAILMALVARYRDGHECLDTQAPLSQAPLS